MRISLDLDDTIICYRPGTPREPPLSAFFRLFVADEPLRLGTVALVRDLRAAGWDVCVYTTSHRPPWEVWAWLRLHGVRVSRVINQDVHDAHFRRRGVPHPPSKNPAEFGIRLHVDDSDGVAEEGRRWGFRVVVVSPGDEGWAERVREATGLKRRTRR